VIALSVVERVTHRHHFQANAQELRLRVEEKMKAARIHEFGSPDVIRIDDVAPPMAAA